MRVMLFRPDNLMDPWLLFDGVSEPAFVHPPAEVIDRIETQNGEVEAVMDDEGEWVFPLDGEPGHHAT